MLKRFKRTINLTCILSQIIVKMQESNLTISAYKWFITLCIRLTKAELNFDEENVIYINFLSLKVFKIISNCIY